MKSVTAFRAVAAGLAAAAALHVSAAGAQEAEARSEIKLSAVHYAIEARLDAASGRLEASAAAFVSPGSLAQARTGEPFEAVFHLHPDLEISAVHSLSEGALEVLGHEAGATPSEEEDFAPREHRIALRKLANPMEPAGLLFTFAGALRQDVEAGETPGAIHNFEMRAHIGEDGVYLAPDGYWYPMPDSGDAAAPLATFEVLLGAAPEPLRLAASAESSETITSYALPEDFPSLPNGVRTGWKTPWPIDGMTVVGGTHEIFEDSYEGEGGEVKIFLHLPASQAQHADGLFQAVKRNFERYEPLAGPYPAREYRVVSNFFSSGFAFPCFTLLSSMVIDMGERAQIAHGYIDHEMLHCWWGNGVFLDAEKGNWCEALATYGANYYGHVLDGDPEAARKQRRNYVHFLSDLPADRDLPLATFGQKDGAGRGIGYSKGAMVFHMLSRQVGQETFWKAVRLFDERGLGKRAGWEEMRAAFDEASGQSLEWFFEQWVRRGGAPSLKVRSASYDSKKGFLAIAIEKENPSFKIALPVRVHGEDGSALDFDRALSLGEHYGSLNAGAPRGQAVQVRGPRDLDVYYLHLNERIEAGDIPADWRPASVELDPDYHVFRKVGPESAIPTASDTSGAKLLATIAPAAGVNAEQEALRDSFAEKSEDHLALVAGSVDASALEGRCVLVLGEAARDPEVAAFLRGMDFPVEWTTEGFIFQGLAYNEPGDSILATARHPNVEGGGVTAYFANSEEAYPQARLMMFYPHSAVVFKDGSPAVRADLEKPLLSPVTID